MAALLQNLMNDLKDPLKEMRLIRGGIQTNIIESFLEKENFLVKDILEKLHIPPLPTLRKRKITKR